MAVNKISREKEDIISFRRTLMEHGLTLERKETTTLQINVGYECNQTCLHCHLDAGPGRKESMSGSIMDDIIAYAERSKFDTIDVTGGAPELNPLLPELIGGLSPLSPRVMLRSNISVLNNGKMGHIIDLLQTHRVVIIASFPSLNQSQSESQRGRATFDSVINGIQKLNRLGYGNVGTGLELNLVSNPVGAFLPPPQVQQEKRFHQILEHKWGIVFNNLFNFANVPLGRFKQWLIKTGNYEEYIDKLAAGFNPCAVDGLMCRTLVSVSWDGYLYDCDFNQAAKLHMGGNKRHISEIYGRPEPGTPISFGDHCYTCTAGTGFT